MDVKIIKGAPKGIVNAPPSKSVAHRMLIAAALSNNNVTINNIAYSDDINATLESLNALGFNYEKKESSVKFGAFNKVNKIPTLNCHESGSTLRFLIPVALSLYNEVIFKGTKKLLERGVGVYETLFAPMGITFEKENEETIKVKGTLVGNTFLVPGNISSQFISGLLFALPMLKDNSKISIITPLESKNYIDITLDVLDKAHIVYEKLDDYTFVINGSQKYNLLNQDVEGDYSNAAFFMAMNNLGYDVVVKGLNQNSYQGDKVAKVNLNKLKENNPIIDIKDCIDLGPVLFTMAALNNGATFTSCERLKIKESDRIFDLEEELNKIGSHTTYNNGTVIITKGEFNNVHNLVFNSHNDHRIAMALSLICIKYGGTIKDAQAVKKSFPTYFKELEKLGIEVIYND